MILAIKAAHATRSHNLQWLPIIHPTIIDVNGEINSFLLDQQSKYSIHSNKSTANESNVRITSAEKTSDHTSPCAPAD
jgi:hypothetical protein